MKTIAVGALTMVFGPAMYPFWPETAVLGPLWSSVVMGGTGLLIVIARVLLFTEKGQRNERNPQCPCHDDYLVE